MSTTPVLAKLPPSKWQPLIEVLAQCIRAVDELSIPDFTLNFEVGGYNMAPYLQMTLNQDGDYLFEIASSTYLQPPLTNVQKRTIESVGWSAPKPSNPNYSKVFDRTYSPISIATYTLTVFRMTFNIAPTTRLIFLEEQLNKMAIDSGDFLADSESGWFYLKD
jgi:hypothetical protein